jgi:hypothetical protein
MRPLLAPIILPAILCASPAFTDVEGWLSERDGIARRATLVEQGIPIKPLPLNEARSLRLVGVPGFVEPEARDENGNVSWLRVTALVAMPAHGRHRIRIEKGASSAPRIKLSATESGVMAETPHYSLTLRKPGGIELVAGGRKLLDGNWTMELTGDARAIIGGLYLREFTPDSIEVEDQSDYRAVLLLKGRYTKNWRKQTTVEEPGRRFDCELRLHVNALSPNIRFAWRITNLTGTKTWLERYALRLPLGPAADRLIVTANFLEDLGRGAGVRRSEDGHFLLHGGLDMPQDGSLLAGPAPDVHRLFYEGMSRTFEGALITSGSRQDAAEELALVDLVLPPQYYSSVKALPEEGDPVAFGEWKTAVDRSAEWLLNHQWRGTLWWGEWYREWDETRRMGVEEASNGNSSLAPLYHYWRTGDARFLRCAKRAAQYTVDIQLSKSEDQQGRMYHTRRHLFDELDWIHPRYQRAKGGIVTSHVILYPAARREIIQTIRSYHEHMFDQDGIPHSWDRRTRKAVKEEDGVDTSNFMEALVYCFRETGDRWYLNEALKMSRWTVNRWQHRNDSPADNWGWNLSQYALRGLVSLYQVSEDTLVRNTAIDVARATLNNKSPRTSTMLDGMGGRKIDNVFFHAWITAYVTRFAPQGRRMLEELYDIVRQDLACQREDGMFVLDHGLESGKPTRWTSFYDAKSLVAYLPVLSARMAAEGLAPKSDRAVCGTLWFQ